jgi:uncharacterized membrane protein YadS
MTHPTQTSSRTDALGTSTAFDAGVVSCVQCVLRLAIILLGSPLPLSQIVAFGIAGLAMTVLGLATALRGAAWPTL